MNKTAVFAILTSVWWLASCGQERRAPGEAKPAPVAVRTALVETAEWPSIYEAVGTVRAQTAATLSAKVMGYVKEVRVDAGDRVRAGQLLVTLDSRDLDAQYRQVQAGHEEAKSAMAEAENAIAAAKAQLELAEATFRRMKDLHDKKSISEQEFDEVAAKLKMAQANHEMALSRRRQLQEKIQQAGEAVEVAAVMTSYTEIKAPFDGTITEKTVEPGNLAAPGAPLLAIEKAGAYRLEARVEESRLPEVHAGQAVEVDLEALERTIESRVSEVVPAVDASSRAFLVKINLPLVPRLWSGLFGRARFDIGSRSVISAPVDAVVTQGQVRSVYVVEDGRARSRLVTLGRQRNTRVEVLSGLAAGEQVVVPIPAGLSDGALVEVRP